MVDKGEVSLANRYCRSIWNRKMISNIEIYDRVMCPNFGHPALTFFVDAGSCMACYEKKINAVLVGHMMNQMLLYLSNYADQLIKLR